MEKRATRGGGEDDVRTGMGTWRDGTRVGTRPGDGEVCKGRLNILGWEVASEREARSEETSGRLFSYVGRRCVRAEGRERSERRKGSP